MSVVHDMQASYTAIVNNRQTCSIFCTSTFSEDVFDAVLLLPLPSSNPFPMAVIAATVLALAHDPRVVVEEDGLWNPCFVEDNSDDAAFRETNRRG